MFKFLSVGCLIVIPNQSYNSGVVCELHDGVCGVDGCTVLSEEGEEQGAEDTPLWRSSVQNECGRSAVPNSDALGSVPEEVSYPCAQ